MKNLFIVFTIAVFCGYVFASSPIPPGKVRFYGKGGWTIHFLREEVDICGSGGNTSCRLITGTHHDLTFKPKTEIAWRGLASKGVLHFEDPKCPDSLRAGDEVTFYDGYPHLHHKITHSKTG